MTRHFLDIAALEAEDLVSIVDRAVAMKGAFREAKAAGRGGEQPLAGKAVAMIFDKPSTRTRVSFDVGIRQLGGEPIMMEGGSHMAKGGESVADTARVLSRYVDAIMIRTTAHGRLLELADAATVPVLNGLTDETHPCQIMADIMTFQEHRGPIAGKRVAWSGDGNNVLNSFLEASARFGFALRVATPKGHAPMERYVNWARVEGGEVDLFREAGSAVEGADLVVTDKWVSMGFEADGDPTAAFEPYRVDEALMARASPDALFMHCLPAKRGEEVTDAVLDGPQSVVLDEAENRLHVQKAILAWCLSA